MSNQTTTSGHDSPACQTEVSTTVAMLISVFGAPFRGDSEANIFEWRLELEGGGKSARLQRWDITADSKETLEQIQSALSSGENYYEGGLHPELFIQRR